MPIEFHCQNCMSKLRVPDGAEGKKVKCPNCENVQTIPGTVPQPPTPGPSSPWEQGFDMPDPFGESGNPYQAPQESIAYERQSTFGTGSLAATQLSFSQAFSLAFQSFQSRFVAFLLLGFVAVISVVIVFGTLMIMGLLAQEMRISQWVIQIFAQVFAIFYSVFIAGLFASTIALIRGAQDVVAPFFSVFRKFLSIFAFQFLYNFFQFIILIPIWVPLQILLVRQNSDAALMIILLSVIQMVVQIFIYLRFWWGFLLVIDQNAGPVEAFGMSWNLTKGNAVTLFCITFVLGIISFLGFIFTLGFGIFVILPFGLCLTSICYLLMSGQKKRDTEVEW